MFAYKFYTNVRASWWLIPVLCVVLGVGFSLACLAVDHKYDYKIVPEWMVGGPDAAMNIFTTVATSMVSLTALVLTIVLVAVQLAMGQPRRCYSSTFSAALSTLVAASTSTTCCPGSC